MDLIFIFRLLYRKLWLLIAIPITAAAITFYFSFNATKLFKSTAQIATGYTTNDEITVTDERVNLRDVGTKFGNLIEKMNSPQVMSLVSYNLVLHDLKDESPFRIAKTSEGNQLVLDEASRSEAIDIYQKKLDAFELLSSFSPEEKELLGLLKNYGYYFEYIKKELTIRRVGFTDFLSVEFSSENPKLSAFVVNTLIDEIIRYEKGLRSDRSSESLEFFASLVEKKKEELDNKTTELNSFKERNNVIDYKSESENRLSQITYYELKRDEEFKAIQGLKLSIVSFEDKLSRANSMTGNTANSKNQKVLELRKKINDLNQIYIEGGSKDETLKGTIDNLRERLQIELSTAPNKQEETFTQAQVNELKSQLDDAKLKLRIAEANLESINTSLWGIKGNVSGFADKESIISNLEKEVDRASIEYLSAVEKYNLEKSKSLLSGTSLRPILKAQPVGEPMSSKTLLKTMLTFFVCLFLCIVGVIVVEYLDFSIKTPAQFDRMTRLTLAGVLNNIRGSNNSLNLGKIFGEDDTIAEYKTFKHLIRKVRFELEKSQSQIVLVTSTQEKVGKSYLIICLAYSLSLINKKVLIVDTNFKNNTLSKLLLQKQFEHKLLKQAETMKRIGTSQDGHSDEDDFRSIISKTAHRNVDLIGSKRSNESPAEILSGRDFNDLLFDLRKTYDYIFLEGASLNDYSDSKELVGFVDIILPVFSAENVIKESDKQSIKYLKSLNGKLIGSVLNKVNEKDLRL